VERNGPLKLQHSILMCALVTNLCVLEHTSESLRVFTLVIPELENKKLLYSSGLTNLKQFLRIFLSLLFLHLFSLLVKYMYQNENFKVYSLMVLNKFTLLCRKHHHPFPELFLSCRITALYPLNNHFHFLLCLAPGVEPLF